MILCDCMLSGITPGYVASMESHPVLKELQTYGAIHIDTLLQSEYRGLVGREVRGHSANHLSIRDLSVYLHLKRSVARSYRDVLDMPPRDAEILVLVVV